MLEPPLLVVASGAAENLEALVDLDRVAVDGNGILSSLPQELGGGDRDTGLAGGGGAEDREKPQLGGAAEQALGSRERGRGGARDLYLDQLAGRGGAVEVDGLVVTSAAAQTGGIGTARPLDQDLEGAAEEALGPLASAPLHELDQALHPVALDPVRYLALHLGRLRAAPRREDKGEGAVVADLVDKLEGLLEVLIGLAGEADDDVGGDRAVRDVLADQRHPVEVALAVVGPAHPLQHLTRPGLQGQMDVLAERAQPGVGADHVLAHVLGVWAGVADPLDPLDPIHPG